MKKSKFTVPKFLLESCLFVFALIFSMNFNACSNNPVSPIQGIGLDSARYNTKEYILYSDIWYSYLADSINIFAGNPSSLILINANDSSQKTLYYGDNFYCINMGGCGQEIYFVGQNWNDPTYYPKPRMKKWTGSGFKEIPIIDSSNKYYGLTTVFLASNNEVWSGGEKGNILKYSNGEFTKYQFDSIFQYTRFFNDELQNLYCMQQRDSGNPEGTYRKVYQYFYKFNSQVWNPVYIYISEIHGEIDTRIAPSQVGNEVLGVGKDDIYKFDGISYKKIISSENFHFINSGTISGSGANNILVVGYEGTGSGLVNFYNWNGKKWSKEYKEIPLGYPTITYANNNYLCSSSDDFGYIHYLKKINK
ncbi:MAG TPA: hypothetical protein VIK14_03625 [Ignavibacteria bacterium]